MNPTDSASQIKPGGNLQISLVELNDKFVRTNTYVMIFSVILYFIIGILIYHFWVGFNFLDSLYFLVITVLTIGYGDFVPHTQSTRLFTAFYIIIGIGICGSFVGTLVTLVLEHEDRMAKVRSMKTFIAISERKKKLQEEVTNPLVDAMQNPSELEETKTQSFANPSENNVKNNSSKVGRRASLTFSFNYRTEEEEEKTFLEMRNVTLDEFDKDIKQLRRTGIIDLCSVFGILIFGMIIMSFIEGWDMLDAFYWSTVTVFTVGYGDFVPTTRLGRIFTMFYGVIGCGLMAKALTDFVKFPIIYKLRSNELTLLNQFVNGPLSKETLEEIFQSDLFKVIPSLKRNQHELSKAEFALLVLTLMNKLEQKDIFFVSKLFDEMDVNKNGVLSAEEMDNQIKKAPSRSASIVSNKSSRHNSIDPTNLFIRNNSIDKNNILNGVNDNNNNTLSPFVRSSVVSIRSSFDRLLKPGISARNSFAETKDKESELQNVVSTSYTNDNILNSINDSLNYRKTVSRVSSINIKLILRSKIQSYDDIWGSGDSSDENHNKLSGKSKNRNNTNNMSTLLSIDDAKLNFNNNLEFENSSYSLLQISSKNIEYMKERIQAKSILQTHEMKLLPQQFLLTIHNNTLFELADIIWCCGTLSLSISYSSEIYKLYVKSIQLYAELLHSTVNNLTTNTNSTLQNIDHNNFTVITNSSSLTSFIARTTAKLFVGLSRMNVQHIDLSASQVILPLFQILDNSLPKMNAQGMANVIYSMGKMNIKMSDIPIKIKNRLLQQMVITSPQVNDQALSNIMIGLNRMDCTWQELPLANRQSILSIHNQVCFKMSPQSISNILYSFGKMGLSISDLKSEQSKIAIEISIRKSIPFMKINDIIQIFYGLSSMSYSIDDINLETHVELANSLFNKAYQWTKLGPKNAIEVSSFLVAFSRLRGGVSWESILPTYRASILIGIISCLDMELLDGTGRDRIEINKDKMKEKYGILMKYGNKWSYNNNNNRKGNNDNYFTEKSNKLFNRNNVIKNNENQVETVLLTNQTINSTQSNNNNNNNNEENVLYEMDEEDRDYLDFVVSQLTATTNTYKFSTMNYYDKILAKIESIDNSNNNNDSNSNSAIMNSINLIEHKTIQNQNKTHNNNEMDDSFAISYARSLSNIIYSLTLIRGISFVTLPEELQNNLINRISEFHPFLSAQGISNVIYSLAKLGIDWNLFSFTTKQSFLNIFSKEMIILINFINNNNNNNNYKGFYDDISSSLLTPQGFSNILYGLNLLKIDWHE
eukprot:gene5584-7709_t